MDLVLIGLLGLLVGSFLNVVIYRLPRGESLVQAGVALPGVRRARQAVRQHPGRSRGCSCAGAAATAARRITARYPLVEALTGGGVRGRGTRARGG